MNGKIRDLGGGGVLAQSVGNWAEEQRVLGSPGPMNHVRCSGSKGWCLHTFRALLLSMVLNP